MKKLPIMMLLALSALCAVGGPVSVQVKAVDDMGSPVVGANVLVLFQGHTATPVSEQILQTDAQGVVRAQGETPIGVTLRAWKPGYYETETEFSISPEKLIERVYILPRVLNPVPLYVARDIHLKLPVQDTWVGYDFETRDWVAPHGKGKCADIRFQFRKTFSGWTLSEEQMASARNANRDKSEEEIRFFYGKWDGVLEVSFANPGEGMVEEEKRFLARSLLKLPHLAPVAGYEPTRRYEANTYKGWPPERATGFFLRTRVKLDAKGNIVSANYGKTYGDLRFDPRGTVRLWYYFNPTPNDRNLEFDTKRNLLPECSASDNVRHP